MEHLLGLVLVMVAWLAMLLVVVGVVVGIGRSVKWIDRPRRESRGFDVIPLQEKDSHCR